MKNKKGLVIAIIAGIAIYIIAISFWTAIGAEPEGFAFIFFLLVMLQVIISTGKFIIKKIDENEKENQSSKYEDLFNRLLEDRLLEDKQNQADFMQVMVDNPRGWEKYCLSREEEYKPKYDKGRFITIYDEEAATNVMGIIRDNKHFAFGWWKYELHMTSPVGIRNSFPDKDLQLSERDLEDIISGKAKGSSVHIIYKH